MFHGEELIERGVLRDVLDPERLQQHRVADVLGHRLPEVVAVVEDVFARGARREPGPLFELALELAASPARMAQVNPVVVFILRHQAVQMRLLRGQIHARQDLHLGQALVGMDCDQGARDRTAEVHRSGVVTGLVAHLLPELGHRPGRDRLAPRQVRSLEGLRVACYYGCWLVRPRDEFDSPERPQSMDRLMQALGADPITYSAKTRCCGGAALLAHTHVVVDLISKVLLAAKEEGADCIALACPMCQVALDAYQSRAEQKLGRQLDIPVLYFTQLMGLALGIDEESLGLSRHIVSPKPLLERLGLLGRGA